MILFLLVFIGGGLGALARYSLAGFIYRVFGTSFPYGTLVVNVVGCFLIGLLMIGLEDRWGINPFVRTFLAIGILGGFTTFSAFTFETIALLRNGETLMALANIGLSVMLCLGATFAGAIIGKTW